MKQLIQQHTYICNVVAHIEMDQKYKKMDILPLQNGA